MQLCCVCVGVKVLFRTERLRSLLRGQNHQERNDTCPLKAFIPPSCCNKTLWLTAGIKTMCLFSALMSLPLRSTSERQLQVQFNLQPSSTVRRSAARSFLTAVSCTVGLSAALLFSLLWMSLSQFHVYSNYECRGFASSPPSAAPHSRGGEISKLC